MMRAGPSGHEKRKSPRDLFRRRIAGSVTRKAVLSSTIILTPASRPKAHKDPRTPAHP
jgi:hypothetical protein